MNDIVKAAIATPGPAIKEVQSRTDRETHKAIQDAVARYQLMFAGLTTTADPNDSDVKTITVDLPAISEVFKEIIDTTKVSEAVRMTQEQFTYHLTQRSTSKTIHDASMNYDAKALNAPKVTALKRAHWADRPLSIEPDSIKDRLGIYHFAPPLVLAATSTSSALPTVAKSFDKKSLAKTRVASSPKPTIWTTPEKWTPTQTSTAPSPTFQQSQPSSQNTPLSPSSGK
jgi:hypothetical protein